MDRKGFTLIELLATVIVLALLMSITGYSVSQVIKSSREENYKLLVNNIKDAAEMYYQECKYTKSSSVCADYNRKEDIRGNYSEIKLSDLVNYGYLKGNSKNNDDDKDTNYNLVSNPKNNADISDCRIEIRYQGDKVNVSAVSGSDTNCPTYN